MTFNKAELLRACGVIYPERLGLERSVLRTLDAACLKSAYRRRALATHPDLHRSDPAHVQEEYSRLFRSVVESYRLLGDYLKHRPTGPRLFSKAPRKAGQFAAPAAKTPRKGPPSQSADSSARAKPGEGKLVLRHLPPWRLRLAEYLFYGGKISWNQMVRALVDQKKSRLRLSDIAFRWGWFSEEKIRQAECLQLPGEGLGETFLRLGLVTSFRLGMLRSFQSRRTRRIGRFFVDRGILSEPEIISALQGLTNHNRKHLRSRPSGQDPPEGPVERQEAV